jgi:hypothetical protein
MKLYKKKLKEDLTINVFAFRCKNCERRNKIGKDFYKNEQEQNP